MGSDSRYAPSSENKKLLLLIATVFGSLLYIQYVELPYSSIFSSLFAANESQVAGVNNFPGQDTNISLSSSRIKGNATFKESSNVGVTNGKDNDVTNITSFNDTSNDDMDHEDEDDAIKDFSGKDRNSTTEEENRSLFLGKTRESKDELPVSNENKNGGALSYNDGLRISPEGSHNVMTMSPPPAIKSTENDTGLEKNANLMLLNSGISIAVLNSSTRKIIPKKEIKGFGHAVTSGSKMNDMLLESRVSYRPLKPSWPSTADKELVDTRSHIENAAIVKKDPHFDVSLYPNFSEFKRSYELMEQTLKVYIYSEGEQPIFHRPPLKGIYASEGWFMNLLRSNEKFVTKNPEKSHLFYLPFSSRMLEVTLYVPNSHNRKNLVDYLSNYVEMISRKYPFWNRTAGSDHFLVACHDWAPMETRKTMGNCIRALCNADIREGFKFGKDISLPETIVRSPQNPLRQLGGKSPSQRKILAFFAGNMHGYLRPMLLKHWENKDPTMKIFGYLPRVKGQMGYAQYMKSSKYCLCPRGYEVNSPRVVEAIFYECVPVIISDNFVPPFFETLNWESFAVFVLEKDIANLKNILESISKKRYLKMQQRVKHVQQHFLWHSRAVRYDVFHMILHSVWYNRVFQTRDW